jgi:protein TonB
MDQPLHDFRPYQVGHASSHRIVSVGAVALFHVIAIYMLASGLAMGLLEKLPTELKADVIPPKQETVKPPPPPPPDLQKPPPPFVPPPDITIQTEAAPTNTITVQSKVATPPPQPPAPPKPAGITAPVSYSKHDCGQRYYPPIAQRLNQEGTTRILIHIAADGNVTGADVVKSSGHDSLDEAAVRFVQGSWRYHPAMENGQPVASSVQADIVWRLNGG